MYTVVEVVEKNKSFVAINTATLSDLSRKFAKVAVNAHSSVLLSCLVTIVSLIFLFMLVFILYQLY